MSREPADASKLVEELVIRVFENSEIDPSLALNIFRLILVHSEKGGLSDSEIEELTGLRQIEVRKVLRMLYEARLIELRKERDFKQDMLRYVWYVDSDALNFNLLKRKKLTLEKLKEKLASETETEWFTCPLDGSRYTLQEAFDNDFACPQCGAPLEASRSSHAEKLAKYIKILEEEIAEDERNLYSH
ncbi:MAG: hypothetical protein QXS85_03055 [Acidilobaceae archaeon]